MNWYFMRRPKYGALAVALLASVATGKEARTVRLNDKTVERILVTPGRTTVLSFPSKPSKVILGNRGNFTIEFVENDIAVAALSASARSNLFVYLQNRRYAFDLRIAPLEGDEIVLVRDAIEGRVKVKIK